MKWEFLPGAGTFSRIQCSECQQFKRAIGLVTGEPPIFTCQDCADYES